MKMSAVAAASLALGSQATGCAKAADYDVVVIGAGVIGACTARELARYDLKVLVLEAGLDLACGSTRANSGIVHAGFDPMPGTAKAYYNVQGAQMFPQWAAELGFLYDVTGAYVLAFDDEQMNTLRQLHERGLENGASETRLVSGEEVRAAEPNVSPDVIGALHVPGSAICDPYGLTFAAAENAAENGVEFVFKAQVTGVKHVGKNAASGASSAPDFQVTTSAGQTISARAVVNAAGINSDTVNNWVSSQKLEITPRRGEYVLYHGDVHAFGATMFQAPTAAGKGVLVGRTAFWNAFMGPTALVQESRTDVSTTAKGLVEVMEKGRLTWPSAPSNKVISTFTGLRATNANPGPNGADFVVGQAQDVPGFFNAACIDSPGLASAPAIAADLAQQVAARLQAGENAQFNPKRQPPMMMQYLPEEARQQLIAQDPAFGRVACHCYNVTEGEILAMLGRVLPVLSIDALKMRCGCTMGPCQGSRCLAKVISLVMDHNGIKLDEVRQYRDAASVVFTAAGKAAAASAAQGAAGAGSAGTAAAAGELPPTNPGHFGYPENTIELPRASYLIPGTRPAGVYSARATMDLLRLGGCAPGLNVVVWGFNKMAMACISELLDAGANVQAVLLGADQDVSDAGYLAAKMNHFGVEVIQNAVITHIDGVGRLTSVNVGPGPFASWNAERTIECDLLVVSADLAE